MEFLLKFSVGKVFGSVQTAAVVFLGFDSFTRLERKLSVVCM